MPALAEAYSPPAARISRERTDPTARLTREVTNLSPPPKGLAAPAARSEDIPAPATVLLEGLTDCREVIDLSEASLPVSELGGLYMTLLHSHPELFHVAPRLSYGYTELPGENAPLRVVTEVYPAYTLTGEPLAAARIFYRDTLTAILTDMELAFGDTPRSEADTVLYLHDYLADRYAYDTRTDSPNADAYSFLREGRGICQAYALTFLALCRGAGLEADLVVSEAMDHAWNHVRVEGVWYHVDVTRDDPIPGAGDTPRVNHARLLRSDEGMEALGYFGYTCAAGHTCTDRRYETPQGDGALTRFQTPLTLWRGKWMGVDAGGGIVGIKFEKNRVFVGKVGDVNLDGRTDPRDLLELYHPTAPEAWREAVRRSVVGREE